MAKEQEYRKAVVKVINKYGNPQWEHFCRIPTDVYDAFFKDKHIGRMERFKKRVRRWVKQDYGVDIQLHTLEDIKSFREFIVNIYKNEYHELFPKTGYCFSERGWVTLWVTKHMEMEIEANEHQTS